MLLFFNVKEKEDIMPLYDQNQWTSLGVGTAQKTGICHSKSTPWGSEHLKTNIFVKSHYQLFTLVYTTCLICMKVNKTEEIYVVEFKFWFKLYKTRKLDPGRKQSHIQH